MRPKYGELFETSVRQWKDDTQMPYLEEIANTEESWYYNKPDISLPKATPLLLLLLCAPCSIN